MRLSSQVLNTTVAYRYASWKLSVSSANTTFLHRRSVEFENLHWKSETRIVFFIIPQKENRLAHDLKNDH